LLDVEKTGREVAAIYEKVLAIAGFAQLARSIESLSPIDMVSDKPAVFRSQLSNKG
jgi:hypothetical protein